jgi:hypothetical protein
MNTRFSGFTRTALLPLATAVTCLQAQISLARAGRPVGPVCMGSLASIAAGAMASAATAVGDDKTSQAPAPSDDAPFAPLWVYQGNWIVTPKNAPAGAKSDRGKSVRQDRQVFCVPANRERQGGFADYL